MILKFWHYAINRSNLSETKSFHFMTHPIYVFNKRFNGVYKYLNKTVNGFKVYTAKASKFYTGSFIV